MKLLTDFLDDKLAPSVSLEEDRRGRTADPLAAFGSAIGDVAQATAQAAQEAAQAAQGGVMGAAQATAQARESLADPPLHRFLSTAPRLPRTLRFVLPFPTGDRTVFRRHRRELTAGAPEPHQSLRQGTAVSRVRPRGRPSPGCRVSRENRILGIVEPPPW